tara:strand:- start:206 stop:481 length:276 start_codon:yes stop_codon:yes gene_type:complete
MGLFKKGSGWEPPKTPNMAGMPEKEKRMRAAQELGLSKAAQKRKLAYKDRARRASQEGAYKFASKMRWRADAQQTKQTKHSYRRAKYLGDI